MSRPRQLLAGDDPARQLIVLVVGAVAFLASLARGARGDGLCPPRGRG